MLLGLVGFATSGKDEAAKALVEKGWERRAFADAIRDFVYKMNPLIPYYDEYERLAYVVDKIGWDEAKKNPEVRELLQRAGKGGRDVFGDEIWIWTALRSRQPGKHYVVTDVRMKNEVEFIREQGGHVIRISRPGVGPLNDHITENDLIGEEMDFELLNDGSLDDLKINLLSYLTNFVR